jgi:hypothetical protein
MAWLTGLRPARVSVHFTAICERFSPHDTTFSIAAAKELKDTKLSAACSLHAASGSTSSSTSSLRRRRLVEIAEEEEEEQRATKRQSVVHEDGTKVAIPGEGSSSAPFTSPPPPLPAPVTLNADLASSPEESNFASTANPPNFIGVPRPPSPAKSFDAARRRMSSQSSRPDLFNYPSYSSYGKQKVKLAPRPSLDVSGRPRTATGNFRPISTIPAGLKLFSKGKKVKKDSDSIESAQDEIPEITFAAASIPIPDAPPIPLRDTEHPPRPHTSGGQPTNPGPSTINFSMPTTLKAGLVVKEKMTPEKARLMKAMQLREKKKKMSMLQPVPIPVIQPPEEDESRVAPPVDAESNTRGDADLDERLSISKADSAIVIDSTASTTTDQASEVTQTDSHPASPVLASSEPDQSTKASSLSESTDETVQAKQDEQEDEDGHDDGHDEGNISEAEERSTPEIPSFQEKVERHSIAMGEDSPTLASNPPVIQQIETRLEAAAEPLARDELSPVHEEFEETAPAPEAAVEEAAVEEAAVEEQAPALPRANFVIPVSKFSTSIPAALEASERSAEAGMSSKTSAPEPTEPVATRDETETPKSPPLRIPKSKFSTQDLRAASSATSTTTPTPSVLTVVSPEPAEASTQEEPEIKTEETEGLGVRDLKRESGSSIQSRASKRKVLVEPIRTDLSEKKSSHNFSDDEDLLDELQSATVQEAKPMLVSKSPITPVFSTKDQEDIPPVPVLHPTRAVSQPAGGRLRTPTDVPPQMPQGSARSVSSGAAFLHKITQQQSANAAMAPKPGKLGSSISQRIKALEKLSGGNGNTSSDSAAGSRSNTPSSTFFSVRKSTIRDPSRSPSVAERANSFVKQSPPPTSVPPSRESSPEAARHTSTSRDRSASVASRLSIFEQGGAPGNSNVRGRPESIQVTARIVRDASQPVGKMPEPRDPSDYTPLELKQSPLVVDHHKAEPAPPMPESTPAPVETPKETIQERRMSKEKRRSESRDRANDGASEHETKPRRSSLSIMKDFIKERRKSLTSPSLDALAAPAPITPARSPSRPPSTHHNTSFPRRLSISSRRSSISKDLGGTATGALSPSVFTETSGSGDEAKPASGDKKKGRAGRFMRRLSASISGTRSKAGTPTGISPTLHEEDAVEAISTRTTESRAGSGGPTIVAYMGDVNVQFPDNLLWKRRSMCLDSQGFLILSAVAATAAPKDKQPAGAGLKRYHLSEFKAPYTPDVEVQELPNSVVLDFVDGSGLQVACEDRAGQLNVLHSE